MATPNTAKKTTRKHDGELMNELGRTGTRIMSGVINEEYNFELAGKRGAEIYDKMRKSDGTIQAILFACELPIRATDWYIEPGETIEADETVVTDRAREIANFVEDALFHRMDTGFDEFLRQELTKLPFGHSVFEKIYKIEDGKVYIKKLAQRLPRTIYAWHDDGSIDQYITGDDKSPSHVTIPKKKLLVFTFRKEGDNHEGVSILRPAYKHWFIKDKLYKIDAVKHERQALGVPYIKLPTGAKPTDKKEAKAILANMRANENAFIVLPGNDWEAGFMDMNAGSTADVTSSIAHHDRQIGKSILAQFLELGAGESGSFALSEDQSTLFLLSLTTIAENFREVVNNDLIKELVDMNFDMGPDDTYPQLKYGKIGAVKYTDLSTTIASLISSGAISSDFELENHIRTVFDLPKKVEEEEEEMTEDTEAEGLEDDPEAADPEDVDAEQELLEDEMNKLEASEIEAIFEENESAFEFAEALDESTIFKTLSPDAKANISKGLIEYWKRRGKKEKPTIVKRNEDFRSKARQSGDKIRQSMDALNQKIDPMKKEIEAIRSGSLGKKAKAKKIREIREKIRAMRNQTNDSLSELKTIRRDSLQGARQTRETIMRRRKAVRAMIKQITDELKARTATRSASIQYLREQISTNVENYRRLKAQARTPEEKANLKKMYEAIKSENDSLRKTGQAIRDEVRTDKADVRTKKEKLRDDTENSYAITDDIARTLGFSDLEDMRIFAETKHAMNLDPIITAQNEE